MSKDDTGNRDSVAHFLTQWLEERPDLDPAPSGITARLNRLAALFQKEADRLLEPLGLSWETFSVIVTLRRVGAPYELRPGELLKEGLLTSGAITNRVDRVEKLGLIERRPSPSDRRSVMVRLTSEGFEKADQAIELFFAQNAELLSGLDGREQAELERLLAKLLGSVEQRQATGKQKKT
jgi:DNA-binding MarR family transcriptional regulator